MTKLPGKNPCPGKKPPPPPAPPQVKKFEARVSELERRLEALEAVDTFQKVKRGLEDLAAEMIVFWGIEDQINGHWAPINSLYWSEEEAKTALDKILSDVKYSGHYLYRISKFVRQVKV